jgi:protein-S-isoprenylcysteine O-methyltransferase Ste14
MSDSLRLRYLSCQELPMHCTVLFPVTALLVFYGFFFYRNIALRRRSGKRIKSGGLPVNLSILVSGLASAATLLHLFWAEGFIGRLALFESRVAFLAGSVLLTAGVTFGVLASLSLRASWRVGIPAGEKTELVTDGLYRYSRNPYFTAFFFVFAGQFLVAPNLAVLVCISAGYGIFHLMILREERHLEGLHGETYRRYRQRVRRYL